MSAPLDASSSENCCSRFACSERTPMTKKLPMPTASRMTRVWLPGRPRLRTACRSGNQRARAIGRTARTTPVLTRCRTSAMPANPPQTIEPDPQRRGLPATPPPTSAAPTSTAAAACTRSMRAPAARECRPAVHHAGYTARPASPAVVPPRMRSSGLTRAHFEQRHEREQQRHEQADGHALPDRRRRQPVATRRRAPPPIARRNRRDARRAASADAQRAARQPEKHDLQHVGRQHLARRRAHALEDRDAADLLADEHARDAPHADAAEHEDDEADQAQVVLGARRGRRRSDPRSRGTSRRRRSATGSRGGCPRSARRRRAPCIFSRIW